MTCDFYQLAMPGVRSLQPYQGGKPIEELEREYGLSNIIKLASNENPLGPSPVAQRGLPAGFADLARYPDGNGFVLRQALAAHLGVPMEQITLGNGSNDILDLLARAFAGPGYEIIFSAHAFAVYPIVTAAVGATPVVVPAIDWGHDLDGMLKAITPKTRLIFIANPNNPTGSWLSHAALDTFFAKVPPHVIVVIDEAYFEYVQETAYATCITDIARHPQIVVTRTFSKAYGLAGLRIGYGIAHASVADLMNRVRQPFNNNALALSAAGLALQDQDHLARSIEVNSNGLTQLLQGCEALGLPYIPSAGNFLCIEFPIPAPEVYDALLRSGVIVRPVANYGMPKHLRVTVGLPEENARFLDVLATILK